jgi:hypothetical protein
MYRCDACSRVVEAGKSAHKRVVETRQREYQPRQHDTGKSPKGQSRRRRGDPGGVGNEIVHEQLLCEDCAKSANSEDV